jgi:phage terminase large subunit-like protein
MYVVAAADGANDGKNISALLIDELHEWTKPKSRSIYTILTGGAQWRDQPITIQITTAGVFDEDAIWYQEYARGKAIEAGEIDDPSYFFRWYEAPEGADYKDSEVWRACNPSFDHLGMERVLRDLLGKRTPNQFRRYHLNQATDAVESWLPDGAWDKCRVRSQRMKRHADTWLAVDASATSDSCSVTWGQWMEIEEAQRFLVRTRIWQPPLDQVTGREVEDWNMPHAEIENFIRELVTAFEVKEIAYDPYNFRRSKDILEDEGLPMLEFPQHPSRTAPATKLMRDSVISTELAHEGSAAMRAQVVAAVTVPVSDVNESFRLSKGKSKKRIDVAASLMMLVGTAITVEEENEPMPGIRII